MDVTFTNGLEGVSQYFQGLPSGSSSTASPAYRPDNRLGRSDLGISADIPQASANWNYFQDNARPPQQHSNMQQYQQVPESHSSQHSETSRPPSHPRYPPTVSAEQSRTQRMVQYETPYADKPQQTFQFQRPQALPNHSQAHYVQSHVPVSSAYYHMQSPHHQSPSPHHQAPSPHHQAPSPHHQAPSPHHQAPSPHHQAPSPHHQAPSPHRPASLSHHQVASPHHQTLSPHHPTVSPHHPTVSPHHPTVSPHHPAPSSHHQAASPHNQTPSPHHTTQSPQLQRASSRKEVTTVPQLSQGYSQPRSYNNYPVQSQPTATTSNTMPYSMASTQVQQNTYYKNVYTTQSSLASGHYSVPQEQRQNEITRTHNLPPIAALSSISYHSSRTPKEPLSNRNRSLSSSLQTSNQVNAIQHTSTSQTNAVIPASSGSYSHNTSYPNYSNLPHYKVSEPQYSATTTTHSYSRTIMSTSTSSNSYQHPQQHTTNSNQYMQAAKSQPLPVIQSTSNVVPSSQPSASFSQPQKTNHQSSDLSKLAIKPKKESPLDLSVKTVRTPADSTLDDVENDQRSKMYIPNRVSTHPTIASHNYPTCDVNTLQRNFSQRSSQLPHQQNVTAPKVEFHPNFSLNQYQKQVVQQPQKLHVPEKPTQNISPMRYQSNMPSRYPSMPVAHAQYPQNQIPQNKTTEVPRIDLNITQKSNVFKPSIYDTKNKRPGEIVNSVVPQKIQKIDTWRQTWDKQIESRFSAYKQEKEQKIDYTMNRGTIVNGNYPTSNELQKQLSTKHMYQNMHHQQYPGYTQTNHNVGNVHSPANQYSAYPTNYSNSQLHAQSAAMRKSIPQNNVYNPMKNNIGGAADKRVLSLLRNSLEVKGAQKKSRGMNQQARMDVPHPSTDVTAPIQPKAGYISRNNVSPFTPTSYPDNNSNMYKFPRAVESINYPGQDKAGMNVPQRIEDQTIIPQNEVDGLAARIRTKGELKQVANNTSVNSDLSSVIKSDTSQVSVLMSLAKITKDKTALLNANAPRKRVFSRTEDDPGHTSVPSRDKSGLRSSSETSVFDFPDSDSEIDMTGHSLHTMRRVRKTSVKPTEIRIESPRPPSPGDDIFAQVCDNFVEALKNGVGKKKGRRKKSQIPLINEILQPPPVNDISVKVEQSEDNKKELLVEIKKEILEATDVLPANSDKSDEFISLDSSNLKKSNSRQRLLSFSDSDSEPELIVNENLTIEIKSEESDIVKVIEEEKENVSEQLIKETETKPDLKIEDTPTEAKVEKEESKSTLPIITRPAKKPSFGDGSDFYPGWEEGVYKYKKSLRMPPTLIQVSRPPQFHRLSTSLPDLDPCPNSPSPSVMTDASEDSKLKKTKLKFESFDSDAESNSSFNIFSKQNHYDSEGGSSNKSLSNYKDNKEKNVKNKKDKNSEAVKTNTETGKSIVDKLMEKVGKRRRRVKKNDDNVAKIIPKEEHPLELLSTPSLEVPSLQNQKIIKQLTSSAPIVKPDSPLLGFRKKTMHNFKSEFIKKGDRVLLNKFTTVVLNSRTRKEARVMKQRATIKEVFGDERPASAPPVTCLTDIEIKQEPKEIKQEPKEIENEEDNKTLKAIKDNKAIKDVKENMVLKDKQTKQIKKEKDVKSKKDLKTKDEPIKIENIKKEVIDKKNEKKVKSYDSIQTKQKLKNKLLNKGNNKKNIEPENKIKSETLENSEDDTSNDTFIKLEAEIKCESPSIDGDENTPTRKRSKLRSMRRKFSSGFDYIRKKKKVVKKEVLDSESNLKQLKPKRRGAPVRANLESIEDIQKEIKTWVLNKGIGETHLHRAARLGYTDITAYCLEKMDCLPSPKDNAGYTPLHEACSRGHLDIAKLLLLYGGNVSESAQGGIRPLHEAVENGFIEIIRLLISYGADPTLATYSGLTPMALAKDDATLTLLKNHMNDIEGIPGPPWNFNGPAPFFDPSDIGFDILDNVPQTDSESEIDEVEFEVSDFQLPNLYTLKGEPPQDKYVLLQDLSTLLKIKSRDALLKQLNPPSSSSAPQVAQKSLLKEMKMCEFLETAHCCQFLNASEKINPRASKIALLKYTDRVKELLNVEVLVIDKSS